MHATNFQHHVLAAEPGDRVNFAHEAYDYANPLEVAAADPPVVWRVPHGDDWVTRHLELAGTRGGKYTVEYNDALDEFHVDTGAQRQRVTEFELADESITPSSDWMSAAASDTDASAWTVPFDVPDGVTPRDVEAAAREEETLLAVLEAVGWPDGDQRARDRIRALCCHRDVYRELNRPEDWPNSSAAERGWQ